MQNILMMAVKKSPLITCSLLLMLALSVASCKKEAALQPGETKDYLVIKDNPSDPVDHALYEFYTATGVPVFYNDTIGRELVGNKNGQPVYFYHKLAISYSPAGRLLRHSFKLLGGRDSILPILPILKNEVFPLVPASIPIHSMLIVESLRITGSLADGISATANKPLATFNTLMLPVVAPDTMSAAGKKYFIASILARVAYKKLTIDYKKQLDDEFHSITLNSLPGKLIYRIPLSTLSPDGSKKAEDFGFIRFSYSNILLVRNIAPLNQDDLLTYLEAAFYYDTTADFDAVHPGYPLVQQKFSVIRALTKQIGFRFAD